MIFNNLIVVSVEGLRDERNLFMRIYRVKITGDRFPTEYTVQASGWGTAISRAIKEWKKRFKGSRAQELTIKIFKSGDLLKENDNL